MVYVGLLFTCVAGWTLLPSKLGASLASRLGFAFAAGAFAISLQLLAYDLLGVAWNRWGLLIPWLGMLAMRVWKGNLPRIAADVAWWNWRRAGFVALLLVPFVIWLPYERVMPLTSSVWDAWAIWLFKARAFYLDDGVRPFLERAAGEFYDHQPGYPLLIPLYGAFLYAVNGGVAELAAKLMTPCFFAAMLGVFYYFAARFGLPGPAMAFTVMVATTPVLNLIGFEYAGYADAALALYFLAAGGFLYAWWRESRLLDLGAASLAATAAAWTKNEGQFFLAAIVAIAATGMITRRTPAASWLILLGPPAAVLGCWTLLRSAFGIESAGFTLLGNFQFGLFSTALQTLVGKTLEWNLFNAAFFLLIGSAAGAVLLKMPGVFWILPGLVVWHLLGVLLAYATGESDLAWWLGTSADRVLAQIVPLALLPGALVFSEWIRQSLSPADKSSASAPRSISATAQAKKTHP